MLLRYLKNGRKIPNLERGQTPNRKKGIVRETSPLVIGSSPIGGVELGRRRSSSRKKVKNLPNPIFQVPLPLFSQGPPQELLQKRLQTDATWHNLKILTEPQGWSRYEKDLWNARSKPENKKKRGFCGRFPLSNASTSPRPHFVLSYF
jgi:hypothetical protein